MGRDLSRVERWWILIGHTYALDAVDWRRQAADAQMVVLAGDPRLLPHQLPEGTIRLCYMSVGETDAARAAGAGAPAGADQSFVIEPDTDWPAISRVDMRDERWQRFLLESEAPRLLGLGFDGLMLDTIDTAPYLENKDPARFGGSRRALASWLARLRERFPHAIFIANGTQALADAAPYVDGFVVEGVFATYDFGRRAYRATTDEERRWKLGQIDRAQAIAARPVFTIEYADFGDAALGRWAADEAARRGFRPYVGVKDLNALP
jgi:uncharacterized protein (TIGR01370 family)